MPSRRPHTPLLSTAFFALLAFAAAPAQTEDRKAALEEWGDSLCTWPSGVYAWTSKTRTDFVLPDEDGPFSGTGSFSITFTQGHPDILGTKTGSASISGHVRNQEDVVFTTIWNDPIGGPGEQLSIPLEPGATRTKSWSVTNPAEGGPCSFTHSWRLVFEREKRVYDIALKGKRALANLRTYPAFDPKTGAWLDVTHRFGFAFRYDFTVRVTLERRKKDWVFVNAVVTRADATASYEQDPEIYRVVSSRCTNCGKVRALAGTSLGGSTTGQSVQLSWPSALIPSATVSAVFAYQCAEGEGQATCERNRTETSSYFDQDTDFFNRARGHDIPLQDLPPPFSESSRTEIHSKTIIHDYRVRRVE
ncbi:hypothetical protein [Marimonas arenosa]|uniref:Uncharacterized protein n=1 Tax=Marimonas arenosa TaxID=1795305 RepID=A0AAE3WE80_9RHOB|nr:hypothetical protein [Marimonas arenosa]MDQ2090145.1 hypothetical protein [Marimonas arenosa]